jgi:GNAT superfamily N-acetyltransferase
VKNKLSIRAARADELERLTELARASKAYWGYAPGQIEAWRAELMFDSGKLASHRVVVAEHDCKALGVASLLSAEDGYHLDDLWVDPACMRRGVGRALVAHIAELARTKGATALRIDGDPHASAFYRRIGAYEVSSVAAPIAGSTRRRRPQWLLPLDVTGAAGASKDHNRAPT